MALLPNRDVLDGTKLPATTTSDMKTALGSLRDFLAGLLGTDSTDLAAARAAMGVGTASRVQGLIGAPNAATPLTKYDLSADAVVLRNAAGGTVARYATGAITNDLGVAGVTANGRDQVAVFPINSWVYLYFIWNGTTIATVSSLAAPTVGPALPSGYTHWAFATMARWNASSNIVPAVCAGGKVFYSASITALAGGTSGVEAAINITTLVPTIALSLFGMIDAYVIAGAGGAGTNKSTVRALAGQQSVYAFAFAPAANQTAQGASFFELHNKNNTLFYANLTGGSVSSTGTTVYVNGFTIPNGDA